MNLDVRLQGPTLKMSNLLQLAVGDVLAFDFPVERPIDAVFGGKTKFRGHILVSGKKRSLLLEEPVRTTD